MVPAAVGPPKTRVAVPAGNMKLVSGVSLAPVQISGQPGPVPGARTIQLPNSVSKPGGGGAGVPVARVTPQQHGGNVSTGYVTFVPANARFVSIFKTAHNKLFEYLVGRLVTARLVQ